MTSPHLSTAEARLQKLPRSDIFRRSHILYLDDHHRSWGAVGLNIEAVKAFSDTIEISERAALAEHRAEVQTWISRGALAAGLAAPWSPAAHDTMEFHNYENLKIACGFELHFKARLLAQDFIVHELDERIPEYKRLAKEQRSRPISKTEVLAIKQFHFDGQENYVPGLKAASLKFSWLTDKSNYRAALKLTDRDLDVVKDFRQLRNQIHLPGETVETPALQTLGVPVVQFLLAFINREIVAWSNAEITKHGLLFKPMPTFS